MMLVFTGAMAKAQMQAFDTIITVGDTISVYTIAQKTDPIRPAESSDTIVKRVDVQARFLGGETSFIEFLGDNFNYPTRCQEEGISSYVQLRFVVDTMGNISDVVALEETKSCPEFTAEAIRLMKISPKWIPAQSNGKFVKAYRILPIRLNLN